MTMTWGRGAVSQSDVEAFARRIEVAPSDRAIIVKALLDFPSDIQSRGMFFDGLVKALRAHVGPSAATRIVAEAEIPRTTHSFTLYAHRDFYKLFFYAAPLLHPGRPLPDAMQAIAETFYPVFRESIVGRTMSVLMGSDPAGILGRLVEAYTLSVQGNQHALEITGPSSAVWRALAEPVPMYPSVFKGIVIGTMRSHDAPIPRITVRSATIEGAKLRCTFDVEW
ncbi:hypothetical protein DB32_008431 [Sandaracinus amylolyticus]|uniref:Uncharacterized protein n=2 Tax=Sandaracinus amylolyticus TaxID=927083 RepID=A0A0F6YMC4_9BACT|nr:hypothetical protein DB32_008431 [Sandaracinus amylolyticus]